MHTSAAILRTMRPKQWTKNLLLFAALIFAKKIAEPASVLQALAAFVLFCALSGAVYLINDVVDAEEDRRHPRKRQRPIASGALSPRLAVAVALALTVGGLVGCFQLNFGTGLSAAAYTVLTLAYHFALKRMVILDALAVSGGFVLRAVAGATDRRPSRPPHDLPPKSRYGRNCTAISPGLYCMQPCCLRCYA